MVVNISKIVEWEGCKCKIRYTVHRSFNGPSFEPKTFKLKREAIVFANSLGEVHIHHYTR